MKNILTIDVYNPFYFTIDNVDNGDNSIFIQFKNYDSSGQCEIYYGNAYYTQITVGDNGLVEIPTECYSDDANMHIRYTSDMITCFTHITGDGSKYEDMVLVKIANCMATITGSEIKKITDYAVSLAEIISGHTQAGNENCYKDLNTFRKLLIRAINDIGGNVPDNATIEHITYSLKGTMILNEGRLG